MVGMDQKEIYVGDEAHWKMGVLRLSRPVDNGLVVHWEDLESIWQHSFHHQLRVAPEEHPVLVADIPIKPKDQGEHMIQLMFEKFRVPAFYVQNTAVLSLYAAGRLTGLVYKSGHGASYAVYEGFNMNHVILCRMGALLS